MTRLKKTPLQYNPTRDLLDEDLVIKAIRECLKDNHLDEAIEILETHLNSKNKNKLCRIKPTPK